MEDQSHAAGQSSRPLDAQTRRKLADVAELYWIKGMKVDTIAHTLSLSRSTVSRMLARARSTGVIRFSVQREVDTSEALEARMLQEFGVRAHVVPTSPDHTSADRLALVAEAAARLLGRKLSSDMILSVAWGATIEAVSKHLEVRPARNLRVVQFNGSGNVYTSGLDYAGTILQRFATATSGTIHYFPVPTFFDSAATKEAMWKERSVRRILALRSHSDVVVSSIGTFSSELPGHLYRSSYLERSDVESLRRDGVVGDLGATFFRADGSTQGIACNMRSSGMSIADMRQLPTRIVVVADPLKAPAVRAVLRTGAATDLVADDVTVSTALGLAG